MENGSEKEAGWMDCDVCDGAGVIDDDDPNFGIVADECPACNGMGYVCDVCTAAPAFEGRGGCWCHY